MARQAGEVIAERYRLEARLGEGGMGDVWSAEHVVTGRAVALKFLLPGRTQSVEAKRRFLREARAASRVDHPSVVAVHDVIELDDEALVMVMDLLIGETLRSRLDRVPPLSAKEAATVLLPVVSAVGTAHQAGVVHRDLKPENIFITSGGETKVLDFGIAKLVEKDEVEAGLTNTGALLGTPHYMSPEQVFGEKDVDARADVWSLGVILYECLGGRRPFEGDNPGQVMKAVLIGEQTPLAEVGPEVPEDLVELTEAMLELRRRDRLTDLVDAFEVLRQHTDVEAIPFSAAEGLIASLPPSGTDSDPFAATKLDTGEEWDELRRIAKAELKTGAPVETMSSVPMKSRGTTYAAVASAVLLVGGLLVWLGGRRPPPDPDSASTRPEIHDGVGPQPTASSGHRMAEATVRTPPTVTATATASASASSSALAVASGRTGVVPVARPVPKTAPAEPVEPVEPVEPKDSKPDLGELPGGVHGEVPF